MKVNFLTLYMLIVDITFNCDEYGVNNQMELINDMSLTCLNNLHANMYLTYGMGVSDALVVIISDTDLYACCTITIHTIAGDNMYLITVIEFPDRTEGVKNACQDPGSTVTIKDPTINESIDVCEEVNKLTFTPTAIPVYVMNTKSSKISINVNSQSLFETLKITATSAKRLRQYERCDGDKELVCMITNITVCVSKELLCDENINCGAAGSNDEDVRICDESRFKRLWLVVLYGTVMVIVIISFLIYLLKTCLPSVPDSFFIFNEDEDNTLILSSKYIAPSEALRQATIRPPPTQPPQTSSFRFKSIPISQESDTLSPPLTMDIERLEDRNTMISDDFEVELETVSYKNMQYSSEQLFDDLQNKDQEILQMTMKRPRFQSNIINIMDYIEQSNSVEEEQSSLSTDNIFMKDRAMQDKKLRRKRYF